MTTKTFDKQIPLLLRLLENALRSGYNLAQSFELATQELQAPALDEVNQLLAEIKSGTPLPEAFANWLKRNPSEDLKLIVATLHVQLEVGGNLADKFQLLGQILAMREKLAK